MNDQRTLGPLFNSSYVLGGSPCSGKSTLAERLSREFNLPYYKADDHMWRHLEQADPQSQPTMAAYAKLSWDQMWSQPVDQQVEDVFAYYTEQFLLIEADLEAYAGQGPIIMEGVAFLPKLVYAAGVPLGQALFLVPTKSFQIAHYSQRDWVQPILESCGDPDQSFANWMERDQRCGQEIIRRAERFGYLHMVIDGGQPLDEVYQAVQKHFGFG